MEVLKSLTLERRHRIPSDAERLGFSDLRKVIINAMHSYANWAGAQPIPVRVREILLERQTREWYDRREQTLVMGGLYCLEVLASGSSLADPASHRRISITLYDCSGDVSGCFSYSYPKHGIAGDALLYGGIKDFASVEVSLGVLRVVYAILAENSSLSEHLWVFYTMYFKPSTYDLSRHIEVVEFNTLLATVTVLFSASPFVSFIPGDMDNAYNIVTGINGSYATVSIKSGMLVIDVESSMWVVVNLKGKVNTRF